MEDDDLYAQLFGGASEAPPSSSVPTDPRKRQEQPPSPATEQASEILVKQERPAPENITVKKEKSESRSRSKSRSKSRSPSPKQSRSPRRSGSRSHSRSRSRSGSRDNAASAQQGEEEEEDEEEVEEDEDSVRVVLGGTGAGAATGTPTLAGRQGPIRINPPARHTYVREDTPHSAPHPAHTPDSIAGQADRTPKPKPPAALEFLQNGGESCLSAFTESVWHLSGFSYVAVW